LNKLQAPHNLDPPLAREIWNGGQVVTTGDT